MPSPLERYWGNVIHILNRGASEEQSLDEYHWAMISMVENNREIKSKHGKVLKSKRAAALGWQAMQFDGGIILENMIAHLQGRSIKVSKPAQELMNMLAPPKFSTLNLHWEVQCCTPQMILVDNKWENTIHVELAEQNQDWRYRFQDSR